MARNASGTHSLPAGNPVTTATTITSTWANDTLSDLSTETTDSLSRSGKGPMLAALELVNGSAATPALSFDSEANTGLYRAGAADVRLSIAGTDRLKATATSLFYDMLTALTATSATIRGAVADGAAAVGVILDNTIALATAGAKALSVRTNGAEKFALDYLGEPVVQGGFACGASFMVAANQTEGAGVATNVTGLSFPVVANATYVWDVFGTVSQDNAGGAVSVLFTGPAAPTDVTYGVTSPGTGSNASATAFSTAHAVLLGLAGEAVFSMVGRLVNGANAGTVQMQFQRTTAGTATFHKGALLRWRRIA